MSSILVNWLNEDVKLSKRVTALDSDFRNGFLLGEVLWHFNQQLDFQDYFVDSSDSTAVFNNYVRLEPTMRALAVRRFNSHTAKRVIDGDRAVTVELLYNVRTALQKITTIVSKAKPSSESDGGTGVALTPPVALANLPIRLSRPVFDDANSRHFRNALLAQAENQGALNMDRFLKGFQDRGDELERNALALEAMEREALEAYVGEIRRQRIQKTRAEHEYLYEWEQSGIGIWLENQRIQRGRTVLENTYKQMVKARREERVASIRNQAETDVRQGLAHIERNMVHLGIIEACEAEDRDKDDEVRDAVAAVPNITDQLPLQQSKRSKAPPATSTAIELMPEEAELYAGLEEGGDDRCEEDGSSEYIPVATRLAMRPGIPKKDLKKMDTFVNDLKGNKRYAREQQARRSSRRRRLLTTCRDHTRDAQKDVVRALTQGQLGRLTAEENRLCKHLKEQLAFADVFKANRAFRKKQEQNMQTCHKQMCRRAQTAALAVAMREYQSDTSRHHKLMLDIQCGKDEHHADQLFKACEAIVHEIVDLSLQHSRVKTLLLDFEDSQMMADLRASVAQPTCTPAQAELEAYNAWQGRWALEDQEAELSHEETEPEEAEEEKKPTKGLSPESSTFSGFGLEATEVEMAIAGSSAGDTVMSLQNVANPPPPNPERPWIPEFELQLAVVGPPCSGKSSVAQQLAEIYSVRVLGLETLVRSAVNGSCGTHSVQAAQSVQAALNAGEPVSDQQYVELVVGAIRDLDTERTRDQELNRLKLESIAAFENEQATGSITEAGRRENAISALFREWDTDGSGFVDASEVMQAVVNYSKDLTRSRQQVIHEAHDVLAQMDLNLDGLVSREELGTYLHEIFKSLDAGHFDQLIVEIMKKSCTRPILKGWVLDGFPTNVTQADLLEQQLSGTRVFQQPHAQPRVLGLPCTPPEPILLESFAGQSALDCVVVLQATDDCVLRRGLGERAMLSDDELSGSLVHVEYVPPDANALVPGEFLEHVPQLPARRARLSMRLCDYRTHEAELVNLYETLDNALCRSVDGAMDDCRATKTSSSGSATDPDAAALPEPWASMSAPKVPYRSDDSILEPVCCRVRDILHNKAQVREAEQEGLETKRRQESVRILQELWDVREAKVGDGVEHAGSDDSDVAVETTTEDVPPTTPTPSDEEKEEAAEWMAHHLPSNAFIWSECLSQNVSADSEDTIQVTNAQEAIKWAIRQELEKRGNTDETATIEGVPLDVFDAAVELTTRQVTDFKRSWQCTTARVLRWFCCNVLASEPSTVEAEEEVDVVGMSRETMLALDRRRIEDLAVKLQAAWMARDVPEEQQGSEQQPLPLETLAPLTETEQTEDAETSLEMTEANVLKAVFKAGHCVDGAPDVLPELLFSAAKASLAVVVAEKEAAFKKSKRKTQKQLDASTGSLELAVGAPVACPLMEDKEFATAVSSFLYSQDALRKTGLLGVLQQLGQLRDEKATYYDDMLRVFDRFLRVPDAAKQDSVNELVTRFNSVPQDLRFDVTTKHELYFVVEKTREDLWALVETKREAARNEVSRVKEDGWILDHRSRVILSVLRAMQHEMVYYQSVRAVLTCIGAARRIDVTCTGEAQARQELAELVALLPAALQQPVALDASFGLVESEKAAPTRSKSSKKGSKSAASAAAGGGGAAELDDPARLDLAAAKAKVLVEEFTAQQVAAEKAKEVAQEKNKQQDTAPVIDEDQALALAENEARIEVALDEHKVRFFAKIDKLRTVGRRLVEEPEERSGWAHAKLESMCERRVLAEIEAVETLVEYVQSKIEAELPITDNIVLRSEIVAITTPED